ncbi:MAG: phosphotransferase [Ardenticatenaceae bacterium]|nr:phosphotransferase [Ardenticatenaceae bacterium]
MIRITRSFIAGDALAELIAQEYEFKEPIQCRLFSKMLRTQDNDHYRVLVGDRKYALRVYQEGSHLLRQESDYEYELAWLDFLREQGLPVSYPIRRADGRFLNKVEAPEGTRYYALFSFAEGQPMNPRNENQLYALGAAMAKIHKVSNNFQTDYKRQEMNLEFLVDRPVARLQRIWGDRPERRRDLDLLVTSAAEAKEEILEIIRNPYYTEDSWGPIGGDFHSNNTFFRDDDNLTFFNFDLCGPGWRAYDIAAFLQNTDLLNVSQDLTEAFFAGYYSERPLSDNEHAAISPLLTIRRVWLTATFTREDVPVGYSFIASA